MRGIVGIQSRRDVLLQCGPAVYCNGVIQGQQGQLEFGCYDQKIQPFLQIGSNVDIEWTEKPGKEYQGQPTTQRTITQLYIDNKPIAEAKQQGKPYGGGYKDSPETRASIEAQTAVNNLTLMIIHDKLPITDPKAQQALAWLSSKLPSVGARIEQKPIEAPRDLFADGGSPTAAQKSNKQLFLKACKKAGYSINTKQGADAVKAWMVKQGTNLPFDELSTPKQAELIVAMQAMELPVE